MVDLNQRCLSTLGGSVGVKSRVGEGTEFLLELPLIAPVQAKPE